VGEHRNGALPAGVPAPDFSLEATPERSVSLSVEGRPLIMAFYDLPTLLEALRDAL
jgi:peroxiredoxin